jgi:hypothetical protein
MHTTGLRGHDFDIRAGGTPATIDDVFPGFDEDDRLGIVITADHGAAGAATLILAAVTAFYDRLRLTGEPFFAYADYFAFHVGGRRGSLRKLDVWPEHKEVVVAAEAEPVLQAINDRGITRLLVPDGTPRTPVLARETMASARRRIRTAVAYAPGGAVPGDALTVSGSPRSAAFVEQMLQTTGAGATTVRATETYRRLTLAEALGLLEPPRG